MMYPRGHIWSRLQAAVFVNYGWPGSTEPGDVWRVRMWPAGGDEGAAIAAVGHAGIWRSCGRTDT